MMTAVMVKVIMRMKPAMLPILRFQYFKMMLFFFSSPCYNFPSEILILKATESEEGYLEPAEHQTQFPPDAVLFPFSSVMKTSRSAEISIDLFIQ